MEASQAEEAGKGLEDAGEQVPDSYKEIIWKIVALIVVLALAVIFVMIGMKLAWIGG